MPCFHNYDQKTIVKYVQNYLVLTNTICLEWMTFSPLDLFGITGCWKAPSALQANITCSGFFYRLTNTFTPLGFDIYTKKTIMFKKN